MLAMGLDVVQKKKTQTPPYLTMIWWILSAINNTNY
jgi:hypothetical protein